jgi:transcriptional regulator GlxA family with amidase domain
MNRRELLHATTLLGLVGALPSSTPAAERKKFAPTDGNPLKPPAQGSIPVAFVISEGAVVIDFGGPWEVFERTNLPGRMDSAFRLYTVAETTAAIHASGGMKIVPDFTFENAPVPKVIVIPAQEGSTPAMLEWIRKSSKTADVTMSVCTGAFVLAQTGLLSGKPATTHHGAYKLFAIDFPDVSLKRGARFTESGNLATAGGLSSGIDLALRVVQRYFGDQVVADTAAMLEYQGQGWLNADANEIYARPRVSTASHPLCAVCDMEVDPKTTPCRSTKARPTISAPISTKPYSMPAPRSTSHNHSECVGFIPGASQRNKIVAAIAPVNCAATNHGVSTGRIPANVSLRLRAIVTAGFANEVDAVNQYAAVIYPATANGTALDLVREHPQITHTNPNVATNSLNTCAAPLRACCDNVTAGSPNIACAAIAPDIPPAICAAM